METEDQQLEDFKKWWKENGSSIITGVVLGLAVLFGTRSWFTWQERTAECIGNLQCHDERGRIG